MQIDGCRGEIYAVLQYHVRLLAAGEWFQALVSSANVTALEETLLALRCSTPCL